MRNAKRGMSTPARKSALPGWRGLVAAAGLASLSLGLSQPAFAATATTTPVYETISPFGPAIVSTTSGVAPEAFTTGTISESFDLANVANTSDQRLSRLNLSAAPGVSQAWNFAFNGNFNSYLQLTLLVQGPNVNGAGARDAFNAGISSAPVFYDIASLNADPSIAATARVPTDSNGQAMSNAVRVDFDPLGTNYLGFGDYQGNVARVWNDLFLTDGGGSPLGGDLRVYIALNGALGTCDASGCQNLPASVVPLPPAALLFASAVGALCLRRARTRRT